MLSPPAELKPPSPRLRRVFGVIWLVCLAFAILAQAGATWRVYVNSQIVQPPFASIGEYWDESWGTGPFHENLKQIDSVSLEGSETIEEIASLFRGRDGEEVTLGFGPNRPEKRVMRSAENRARIYRERRRTFFIASQFIDVLVAALIVVVAFMLRRRGFREPVTILLSFALLFMAAVGTQRTWGWLGLPPAAAFVPDLVWLALLLIACPAFPTGRYAPRWTRWFTVAVPVGIAILAVEAAFVSSETLEMTIGALNPVLVLTALLCVILRFRYTPRGAERQKMKWASLGLGAGLFLYAPSKLVELRLFDLPLPVSAQMTELISAYALNRLSYVIIALGLLAPLLGFRLNDADAAIGRSAAYAAVTTLVVAVWAVGAVLVNELIEGVAGPGSKTLSAAISSVVALAVFPPARTRMLNWTEARFQGALLRLRSLPEKIARWQHDDDPRVVAERILRAIAEGVDATAAAIVRGADPASPEILSLYRVDADAVRAYLAGPEPKNRSGDDFPLRLQTDSPSGPLRLLIGRRSDGASYTSQERGAVAAICEPLADALHAVSLRAAHNAELAEALGEIKMRLQQMSKQAPRRRSRPTAAKPSPSR